MRRIHAKRGGLACLLCLGVVSAGCEEWWGDGDDPDLDASISPGVPGDAALDTGTPAADAGMPVPDAAPSVDGGGAVADAAVDANPGLDAAAVLDATLLDAATDAPPDAAQEAAAPDTGPDAAPDAAPATALPCDVAQVLETRCQSCHGDPPMGAPIKLVTLADLQATSPAGGFVYQRVQVRVDGNTMPPAWATTGALTGAEKATLTSWTSAGAPGSSASCQ